MLTISAADEALFTAVGGRCEFLRVDVKDSGGTWRDLTTYPGENMVLGATWNEDVDSPSLNGTVRLKREVELLSLAPLMDTSALNLAFNPAGSPSPLVAPGREIKLFTAVLPDGQLPGAGDWREKFHGRIDKVRWPAEVMELLVSDKLQGDCRDAFIERERVYAHADPTDPHATKGLFIFEVGRTYAVGDLVMPTEAKRNGHFYDISAISTGVAGAEGSWPTSGGGTATFGGITVRERGTTSTSTGTSVETVLQQIATDNGTGVTVTTPSSPGWLIKWYLQQRVNTWQAMSQLVDQIGWDLRPRWDSGSSSFKLKFTEIDRAKTTPDRTFSASEKIAVTDLEIDRASIRNVVRVLYWDPTSLDAGGNPTRQLPVERTNAGSVTTFGRRFIEIAEASSSQIDTQAEAEAMADAALSDLASPTAEKGVTLEYFPFVELGDLYRFSGDGVHHSGNLDLAVTGYTHTIDASGEASTQLRLRGKPSGGVERWLAKAAEINPDDTHQTTLGNSDGLSIVTEDVIGGTKIRMDPASTFGKHALAPGYEVHLSTTPGFTPDASTLAGSIHGNELVAPNLQPGVTYYCQAIPFGYNARRLVRGQPSEEVSFVAGRASSGHIHEGIAIGDYPLNGGFETRLDLSGMPDHWTIGSGVYNTNIIVKEDGNGVSGGRYLRLVSHASNATNVSSALIPIVNEAGEANRYSQLYRLTAWLKFDSGNSGGNIEFFLTAYDYAGVLQTAIAGPVESATTKKGHWYKYETTFRVDSDVDIRSIRLTLEALTGSPTFTVDVDEIRIECIGTKWYAVGDTTKYTENYESIPAFGSGWANYGSGNEACAFRKDRNGRVYLKGLAVSATHTLGSGNKVFVLPPGFCPPELVHVGSVGNGRHATLEIDTSGNVYAGSADSATWAAYFSIDCSFETFA